MLELKRITPEELEERTIERGLVLPIEQTAAWQSMEAGITDRSFWGSFEIVNGASVLGYVSFTDYLTHGYHYLRAHHAPIWIEKPDAAREEELIRGLAAAVASLDPKIVFIRCSIDAELSCSSPTLSTMPYDTTVIVDLSGDDEDRLSRMKPRGRRDVRKALRECPASFSDETDRARASFDEYYQVILETAERDGFSPSTIDAYQNMLDVLAPNARVFCARLDDKPVSWSIVTISGKVATRYYGASTSQSASRRHATDALVFHECHMLAEMGCTQYDLMGIGSEFCPETYSLTEFKTKFAKGGVAHVAPDRDVPVRRGFYKLLTLLKRIRKRIS